MTEDLKKEIYNIIKSVEENSRLSFSGVINTSKWWKDELINSKYSIENLDDFVLYMKKCPYELSDNGLMYIIDGTNNRSLDEKDYKDLIAMQLAYNCCVKSIIKNTITNSKTLLEKVEFGSFIKNILDFDKASKYCDALQGYDTLIITNIYSELLSEKVVDNKNDRMYIYTTIQKDRVKMFFEDLIKTRQNNKKNTILIFKSDYEDVLSLSDSLGPYFGDLMKKMFSRMNFFNNTFISEVKCCRFSLLNNKNKSIGEIEKSIKKSIMEKFNDNNIPYSNDLFLNMKNKCEELGADYISFISNIHIDLCNALKFGEIGVANIKRFVLAYNKTPDFFICFRS